MRVFVIDTRNMGPELRGGLIAVVGSVDPTAEEKNECVETVSRHALDGWAIAADPHTPIGRLAALTAKTVCVPFVALSRLARMAQPVTRVELAAPRTRELSYSGRHVAVGPDQGWVSQLPAMRVRW